MFIIPMLIAVLSSQAAIIAPTAAVLGVTAAVSDDKAMDHYNAQMAAK